METLYMVESAWATAVTYQQDEFPRPECDEESAHLPLIDNLCEAVI